MKRGFLFVVAGLVLVGCGAGEAAKFDAAVESKAVVPMSEMPTGETVASAARSQPLQHQAASPPAVLDQRKVIRKAELSVRVKDVEKSEKDLGQIVRAAGGYVESASSTDLAGDKPKIEIQLRIPSPTFDTTLAKVEGLGVRLAKQVSSEDVTTQLVDMDARLKTMSAEEETIRNLVRKSSSLETIMRLQERLTDIRSQIESVAAQRKAMAGLASLSTVKVTLEQSADASAPARDPSWLSQTWGEAMGSLASTGRVAMIAAVWVLVFSPIWIPGVLLARKAITSTKPKPNSTKE